MKARTDRDLALAQAKKAFDDSAAGADETYAGKIAMSDEQYLMDQADAEEAQDIALADADEVLAKAQSAAETTYDKALAAADVAKALANQTANATHDHTLAQAEAELANATANAEKDLDIALANAGAAWVAQIAPAWIALQSNLAAANEVFASAAGAAAMAYADSATSAAIVWVQAEAPAATIYSLDVASAAESAAALWAAADSSADALFAMAATIAYATYINATASEQETYAIVYVTALRDQILAEVSAEANYGIAVAAADTMYVSAAAPIWASYAVSAAAAEAAVVPQLDQAYVDYVQAVAGAFVDWVDSMIAAEGAWTEAAATAYQQLVSSATDAAQAEADEVAAAAKTGGHAEAEASKNRLLALATAAKTLADASAGYWKTRQLAVSAAEFARSQALAGAELAFADTQNSSTSSYVSTTAELYAAYQLQAMAANQQFVDVQSAARTQEVIDTTAAKATYELTLAGLSQDITAAQNAYDIAFAEAQDAVYYASIYPAPDTSSAFSVVASFFGSLVPTVAIPLAIGLGVVVLVGALTGSCAVAAAVGIIFVGFTVVSMLLNGATAAMNRMSEGQSIGGAIGGGIAEVTPVSPIWRGATGTDIVTGANLHLSPSDRAAELGRGVGELALLLMAARAASRFSGCFVAGTQVVLGKEDEVLIAGHATTAAEQPGSAQANSLLVTTCVAVGAIGFIGLRRRKQSKPTYRQSVDELLASQDVEDNDWKLPDLDELPMHVPLEQIEQEGLAEAEPWEREFGLPIGARGAKLRVVPGKTVKRASPIMQERIVRAKKREMSAPNTSPATRTQNYLSWLWLAACLCAAAIFFGRATSTGPTGGAVTAHSVAYTAPQTQNIEQIRVGDRVATNLSPAELAKAIGEASNAPEWDHLDAQIDPAAWRQVEFVAQGEQGQRFEITLLRPLSWLEEAAATVGGQIHLVLPEQGLDGPATVLAIHACPPIQSGSGRVVTGTITHIRGGILNLYVEGESEPLGVTENHPIYSVRHCDFVSAGDLQPGDQLRKLDGTLANINRVESLIGEQRVFNLEVHGEHVYRVTSNGLLVHNACPDPRWTKNYDPGELVKDHKLARVFGGSDDPTNIRLLALEANARKGGYEGNLVKFRNWLMANGMNEESANLVIKPELDALMNGVAERPMDPSFFDQF